MSASSTSTRLLAVQRWRARREHDDGATDVLDPFGSLEVTGLEPHVVAR